MKEIGVFPQADTSKSVNPKIYDSPWNFKSHKYPDFLPN
ncbi:hypothetical protein MARI151_50451 [Maribacter litoralis]|uniref:Uncharacterized protein n=1 Tax=Maribacter litoralis TaxID=2059726 RepID=A0A653VDI6_9FLAO|nr:hypothetical protein MARI151_50451 [Maribacter litoralis]